MNRFNTFLKIEFLVKIPFLFLIYIYRYVIKPFLGGQPYCRFSPSCSEYALQSFKKHSLFRAFQLTFKRLSKCHPFGAYGYDPIPLKKVENKV